MTEVFHVVEHKPGLFWAKVRTQFSIEISATPDPLKASRLTHDEAQSVAAVLHKKNHPDARVVVVSCEYTLTPV